MNGLIEIVDDDDQDKRQDWPVLGRVIGTATGWDEIDGISFQLYAFEPAVGVAIPAVDTLGIIIDRGKFESYDDDGNVTFSLDIVETLRDIPRKDE